jgi:hypothetical protein
MKIIPLTVLLLLHPVVAGAQNLAPPEVVRSEIVHVDGDEKTVTVGNAQRHYSLFCNVKTAGCITPGPGKNYLLFDAKTRWKMPGAKDFITLAFVQDWTVKYNQGENIGLVPEDAKGDLGIFLLDRTGGGYEQDTIFSDGPIIYGTGMSDADRQMAWKHFFLQMVEAVARQQGQDALGVKLAKRCLPGRDFCTTILDANFVGVGGIQEPRKVLVLVATDIHDPNNQQGWSAHGQRRASECAEIGTPAS